MHRDEETQATRLLLDARLTRRHLFAAAIVAAVDFVLRPTGVFARTLVGAAPSFLNARELLTIERAADAMLGDDALLPPSKIAARTAGLLASIDNHAVDEIRSGLWFLEWLLPALLIFRPRRFSSLGRDSRRGVITKLIQSRGQLRDLARSLRVMTAFSYYTEENVRRSIGYVDFEDRAHRKQEHPA